MEEIRGQAWQVKILLQHKIKINNILQGETSRACLTANKGWEGWGGRDGCSQEIPEKGKHQKKILLKFMGNFGRR